MSRVPTVLVVNPSDPTGSGMLINESDFVEGVHERYSESSASLSGQQVGASNTAGSNKAMLQPTPDDLRGEIGAAMADSSRRDLLAAAESDDLHVGKGPGGKWFVWRGKQTVSGRFDTEAEAADALRNMREPAA